MAYFVSFHGLYIFSGQMSRESARFQPDKNYHKALIVPLYKVSSRRHSPKSTTRTASCRLCAPRNAGEVLYAPY